VDPVKRYTIKQAKNSNWMRGISDTGEPDDMDIDTEKEEPLRGSKRKQVGKTPPKKRKKK